MTKVLRPDKWLFICSANISRSPTAEHLARKAGLIARSCGTGGPDNGYTVTPMTKEIVEWADVIVCMREGHQLGMQARFPYELTRGKKVFIWDIRDKWAEYVHPEMVAIMELKLLETMQQYDKWLEEKAGRQTGDAPQLE